MQQCYGVADLGIGDILDAGDHKADLARGQCRDLHHRRGKDPDFQRFEALLVDINWILSPFLSVPSMIRTRMITP